MIITVTKDFRNFKAGMVFDFSALNGLKTLTIVGDNGSGKSSLIHALRGHKDDFKNPSLYKSDFKELSKNIEVVHNYEKIYHLDNVKDNGSDIMNGFDAVSFLDSGGYNASRMSHGQGSLYYISKFMDRQMKDIVPHKTLMVFDEIDNGLSLQNMAKFVNFIHNIVFKYNCHALVISHNPFFISQSMLAYDINKRDIVFTSDYILEQTGYELVKPEIKTTELVVEQPKKKNRKK